MTSHTDIVAAFVATMADFHLNHNRFNNVYIQLMFESIATILHSLKCDTVREVQNLMGIIKDPTSYTANYGVASPHPTCPKAEAVLLASQTAEIIHKLVLTDWGTYHTATTESNKFFVAAFGRTWISSLLKESPIYFAEATTNELLQAVRTACTGLM